MLCWRKEGNNKTCNTVQIKSVVSREKKETACRPYAMDRYALSSIIARPPNFDLSKSTSALRASYQLFAWSYNRWCWRLYRSFLHPNKLVRPACPAPVQHYFEKFRNPFLLLWCANGCPSYPKSSLKSVFSPKQYLGGELIFNLFTNCIIVENYSNVSFYLGSLCVASPVFPRYDYVSDSTTSIPSSNALRRKSPMQQARKWAVTCGWYSSCAWAHDGQPMMCVIVSLLPDWQHLHVGLRSLLNLWAWASVYHWLLKLLHAWALDNAVDVTGLEAMW